MRPRRHQGRPFVDRDQVAIFIAAGGDACGAATAIADATTATATTATATAASSFATTSVAASTRMRHLHRLQRLSKCYLDVRLV